jgi:hypothetical protein
MNDNNNWGAWKKQGVICFCFALGLWHGVLRLQFRKSKARIQLHSELIENASFLPS